MVTRTFGGWRLVRHHRIGEAELAHLDPFTASLVLGYLQRIDELEHQVRVLQANVRHPQLLPREGPAPWREPHA